MAYRPNYVAANVLALCVLAFSTAHAALAVAAPPPGTDPFTVALLWTAPLGPALFLVGSRIGSRFLMTFAFATYLAASIWIASATDGLAAVLASAFLAVALVAGWVSARSGPLSGVTVGATPP